MVEDLIETLETSRVEYGSIKGRGFDFEGGLVKLSSELRKTMSEKYIIIFPFFFFSRFQLYSFLFAVLH